MRPEGSESSEAEPEKTFNFSSTDKSFATRELRDVGISVDAYLKQAA